MAVETGARRVVVFGGGFAGLSAVRALSRAPAQVTLLDRLRREDPEAGWILWTGSPASSAHRLTEPSSPG